MCGRKQPVGPLGPIAAFICFAGPRGERGGMPPKAESRRMRDVRWVFPQTSPGISPEYGIAKHASCGHKRQVPHFTKKGTLHLVLYNGESVIPHSGMHSSINSSRNASRLKPTTSGLASPSSMAARIISMSYGKTD